MMELERRRRALMEQRAGTGLPSAYQQVEYIETDGACRIDTGVQFDGTKNFIAEVYASQNPSISYNEATTIGWSAGGSFGFVNNGSVSLRYWYDNLNTTGITKLTDITSKTKCEMIINAGANTQSEFSFSNVSGTSSINRGHANVTNRLFLPTFPLFALSNADSLTYAKNGFRIYEAKMGFGANWKSHLVPCYRKSDSIIGMYDLIKRVFRQNLGTGTFKKGADV